ncbi:MAG: IS5 family transposase [Sulfuricaulis sp.]
MKQTTFASLAFESKKKLTRRERFLAEMDQVVPWVRLLKLIAPHYPKAGNGRQPMPLETMLRIYFLQQWFNLSDPAAEDSLYDIESMRRFCGIELGDNAVPDETTILNFRRFLERHQLTEAIFQSVNKLLSDRRLLLKSGTLVDATIIAAPSSTKNEDRERDPEMSQTKKGNQWYFGMKVHIGTDRKGIVHTVTTTTARDADITQLPELLHGKESVVHGDRGYYSHDAVDHLRRRGIRSRLQKRASSGHPLSRTEKARNKKWSSARAFVEHPFHVIKRLWGFAKVRYRGLAKNTARVFALLALANLYRVRHRLMPHGA